MKSKGGKVNLDNLDNLGKYTLTDASRLWMVWWNRNAPDLARDDEPVTEDMAQRAVGKWEKQ